MTQTKRPRLMAINAGAKEGITRTEDSTLAQPAQARLDPLDPEQKEAVRRLRALGLADAEIRGAMTTHPPSMLLRKIAQAEALHYSRELLEASIFDPAFVVVTEATGGAVEPGNADGDGILCNVCTDWENPIPFNAPASLPPFPLEALPDEIRSFVEEVSRSRQVPPDLPGVLSLGVMAASGAGKFRVKIGATHSEPVNVFAAVVLPPGSRKSDTFRDMTLVLEERERELAIVAAPTIAKAKERRNVEEGRLKTIREKAAKSEDAAERNRLAQEAAELAGNLTPVPAEPRLIAGDVTPERLASLLHEQGGRLAVMDAEAGGVFDIMAGRYTRDGSANLDVFLRGHAGDAIRVDRVGRAAEFVKRPALTLVLTPQPDVIRSLADKPGFRGRGLLARFLYAIPESQVGTRTYQNRPISEAARVGYNKIILAIVSTPSPDPADPEASYELKIEGEALALWAEYADAVEAAQADGGELAGIRDFASKLAGAVARIAGRLHLVEHAHGTPWAISISTEIVAAAWAIGDYFQAHALAAFGMMGADPDAERAQAVLRWIERTGVERFTLRDCHQIMRRAVSLPSDLLPAMEALEGRGFIRRLPDSEKSGPGRKPSPSWIVNPINRTRNSQNSREGRQEANSVNSVYALPEGESA